MANKTAMQELLEWTRKTLPMDLDTPRMIEAKIESLLPVEKKQIINAYNQADLDSYFNKTYEGYAEKYYKETYEK